MVSSRPVPIAMHQQPLAAGSLPRSLTPTSALCMGLEDLDAKMVVFKVRLGNTLVRAALWSRARCT